MAVQNYNMKYVLSLLFITSLLLITIPLCINMTITRDIITAGNLSLTKYG